MHEESCYPIAEGEDESKLASRSLHPHTEADVGTGKPHLTKEVVKTGHTWSSWNSFTWDDSFESLPKVTAYLEHASSPFRSLQMPPKTGTIFSFLSDQGFFFKCFLYQ